MFVHLRECSDIFFKEDTDTDEVLTCLMCSNHRMTLQSYSHNLRIPGCYRSQVASDVNQTVEIIL